MANVQVTYVDGRGVLRDAIARCTQDGFAVADISTRKLDADGGTVTVRLELHGTGEVDQLAASLSELSDVLSVSAERPDDSV